MMNKGLDVIIIGGSYSGLAAAMGLGRALRNVLVIDSGAAANRFTPHSHNFLTQDGTPPGEITRTAKKQLDQYQSVSLIDGNVVAVDEDNMGFAVKLASGSVFHASKLVFATGIIDELPNIPGLAACWGKSVLHCPYCHGYEIRNATTGILGNGDYAFEFGALISNWTSDLAIYTNGVSKLTREQAMKFAAQGIRVIEKEIARLDHQNGNAYQIVFRDETIASVLALYTRPAFRQHCDIPAKLGCEITSDGYIKIDAAQRTTVPGVYACGDNVTKVRTVANAVAMGTATAITLNKDFINESF